MKKIYIKPEIEEMAISMQLLVGSPKIDFMQTPDSEEDEDDVVGDFDQLL